VIGLREGSFLIVEGNTVKLGGSKPMKLFLQNQPPAEISNGTEFRIDQGFVTFPEK